MLHQRLAEYKSGPLLLWRNDLARLRWLGLRLLVLAFGSVDIVLRNLDEPFQEVCECCLLVDGHGFDSFEASYPRAPL
jgi:hypothetical protein